MDSTQIARALEVSVRKFPEADGSLGYFVMNLATAGDAFPQWGTSPVQRDKMLRAFYVTEPWLASAVASLAARNAAFSWTVEGGPRTAQAVQNTLHMSDYGKGWITFLQKVSIDLLTQDNGAFIEVIREGQTETGAVIGLAHLDAGRCVRTGNPEIPVIYTDMMGTPHRMKWFQIVELTDAPSPMESMYGMQLCAVSRVLLAAQVLRDIARRDMEKLSGRFAGALHLVSGINQKMLDDSFNKAAAESDNRGRTRYMPPMVVGTLDPNAKITHETIELASLPEGYNEEAKLKWYIAVLALGFQVEYQDLAPLPGGGLGTSTQSQVLHMKAKGKGPELFRKLVEHALNFHVLPQNVNFRFTEEDLEAKAQDATYRKLKAEGRKLDIESGVLTPKVERQIMVDEGDLREEYLAMLEKEDQANARIAESIAQGQGAGNDDETLTDEATDTGNTPEDETVGDEASGKALREADYWAGPRTELENALEEDMTTVLGQVRRRVEARIRQEVEAGG